MHDKTKCSGLLLAAIVGLGSSSATAGLDDWLKRADGLLNQGATQGAKQAGSSSVLSDSRINAGLKQALSIGAERAISILGANGGFINDPSVRIELPGLLKSVGKGMHAIGQGKYVDQFETTVNSAAEEAISKTLSIVLETIKTMTLQDVHGILSGGDDAATRFLQNRSGPRLQSIIKPIVAKATNQTGATAAYKGLRKQPDSTLGGFMNTGSLDLDDYVTRKTLDGLFLKLAAEEKKIRQNPVARTTDLLKQVFAN